MPKNKLFYRWCRFLAGGRKRSLRDVVQTLKELPALEHLELRIKYKGIDVADYVAEYLPHLRHADVWQV